MSREDVIKDLEAYAKGLERTTLLPLGHRLQGRMHTHTALLSLQRATPDDDIRAITELETYASRLRHGKNNSKTECTMNNRMAVDALLLAASVEWLSEQCAFRRCAQAIGRAAALCVRFGEHERGYGLYMLSAELYEADGTAATRPFVTRQRAQAAVCRLQQG